ncbi:MAG: hypothetical protein P0S96_03910 [Simkaniaceae bacterium]|nr:hypothetical protein [Candidatus Sacchlamyda saccharinae]
MQRFFLAAIVGSLAVMTGCGQNNNEMMKSRHGDAKDQVDEAQKTWMEDNKEPMPSEEPQKDTGDQYYYRSECN